MDHLSHTQFDMFMRCPAQYMFRYVKGIKLPPPGPLFFGKVFDDTMNKNYEQKIKSDKDLKPGDVRDIFVSQFDGGQKDVEWKDEEPDEYRSQGIDLVDQHMVGCAPVIHPAEVQPRIEISGKNRDYTIVTVPDIITREQGIIDVKTTGRRPTNLQDDKGKPPVFKISPGHILQASIYAVSFLARTGGWAQATELLYHIRKKASEILKIKFRTSRGEAAFAMGQIDRVAKQIKFSRENSVFIPNRGHMMCSQKHCGYWKVCHETYGPAEMIEGDKGIREVEAELANIKGQIIQADLEEDADVTGE